MSDPRQTYQDVANGWREQQYRRAREEADAALEQCGCDATSAQIEALFQARTREAEAVTEFMRVLKIFHECVTSGAGPGS